MKYKEHYSIIIKFTENDNIPSEEGKKGWVDYFADLLHTSLQYQINGIIEINKKSETELISATEFDATDLVLYIVSPAFIFSSNINQDAEIFEKAFNFDIPYINSKLKKVLKAPIKLEDLPLSLSTPTYYQFFEVLNAASSEYNTFEGWSQYQDNNEFWEVFADVISDTLTTFSLVEETDIGKIFISNKNTSYYKYRNNIKRELKAFNVGIYPDEDFSIESSYMEDADAFFINKSNIALHFPDEFIELTTESRTAAFEKLPEKKRYIWFSPLETIIPEKKAKYNELKIQLKPYQNIESIESPIEELKVILKHKLLSPEEQTEKATQKEILYIISDSDINDKLRFLIQESDAIKRKFEVKILSSVQNVADYRLMHYNLLRTADSFMILYFKHNIEWLKTMMSEIRKAPGFDREKAIQGKYILTSTNSIPEQYINQQFKLITVKNTDEIVNVLPEIF